MRRLMILVLATVVGTTLCGASVTQAQGLLWQLPAGEKTWCRYEGTYQQVIRRPESTEGDLTLDWTRHVTLKSLGKEDAEYKGQTVPCRWIEIKVITGKVKEGLVDAGPGNNRIYKLLVPESEIRGTVTEPLSDSREMYISYIPIAKGYRKIGDEPTAAIEGGVFDLYPMVSFLRHYRTLEVAAQDEIIASPVKELPSRLSKGTQQSETPTLRTTSTGELYRSAEAPFGMSKWTVKVVTERKQSTSPRTEFAPAEEVTETMLLNAIGEDAESELVIDDVPAAM
ncbi:MAG: hypothetical protein DWH91_01055 [Planctomycetota bacterium]|nr:MAG: hypothetical protein DWH91_01055 [Planctomycetota bacterium]